LRRPLVVALGGLGEAQGGDAPSRPAIGGMRRRGRLVVTLGGLGDARGGEGAGTLPRDLL